MWTTTGIKADWMCLLANTREGDPHRNKSLICLPMNTPGVSVAKEIKKIGNYSSDTAQIYFDNVVVPRKNIIGEEGQGFTYQMLQFQEERMWAVASSKLLRWIMHALQENLADETIPARHQVSALHNVLYLLYVLLML